MVAVVDLMTMLRGAFDVTPSPDREKQVRMALEKMPEEVATAAVRSLIDNEDTFPRGIVAALNRHAKAFGWEPPRAVVQTPEERVMFTGCDARFRAVFETARPAEAEGLEYYGTLGAFRWAVRSGSWPRVRARLDGLGEQARAAAAHVEQEVKAGTVLAGDRQEAMI